MATGLEIFGFVLMLVGLAGTVLPLLPGAPIILAGAFLVAWSRDFILVGGSTVIVVAVLMLISFVTDFVASTFGAKRAGASGLALMGATIGAIVGIFAGIIGILIGPFVGAILGELVARRDLRQAWRAGLGTWIGMILAGAVKLGLSFAAICLVAAAYFF